MPVAINPSSRQQGGSGGIQTKTKGDALDKELNRVMAALQIANQGFGMAVNWQNFQKLQDERARMPTMQQAQDSNAIRVQQEQANLDQTQTNTQRIQQEPARQAAQKATENVLTLQKEFRNDPQVQKNITAFGAATNIEDLLEKPTTTSLAAARTQLARASGEVGALSNQDIQAYSPDPSFAAFYERFIAEKGRGEVRMEDLANYRALANIYKQKAETNLNNIAQQFSQTTGASLGLDPNETIEKHLRPDLFLVRNKITQGGDTSSGGNQTGSSSPNNTNHDPVKRDLDLFRKFKKASGAGYSAGN